MMDFHKHGSLEENGSRIEAEKNGMSSRIWGLHWNELLPQTLPRSGATVRTARYPEIEAFARQNFARIYPEGQAPTPFLWRESGANKHAFYDTSGDFFLFSLDGRDVGFFVSNAIDWSSYYLRNASFLPEVQGRGIYQEFLELLLGVLQAHGIARTEGHIAPSHHGHIHVFNKLKFKIAGIELSERWGSLVHFVLHLQDAEHEVFLKQFCMDQSHRSARRALFSSTSQTERRTP